ncbi:unnamed protein product [Dibothriocephalus latus]|uniref:Uncharacterized protein n=1 Tax=Dibothriocephalus latus TaxID=60516 RepID=A0A3P7N0B6_DIBLA|nr:unnamed protein product [Dibothriocephalus latus]
MNNFLTGILSHSEMEIISHIQPIDPRPWFFPNPTEESSYECQHPTLLPNLYSYFYQRYLSSFYSTKTDTAH